MLREKRVSKRRWLARAKLGRFIPMEAVVAHRLGERLCLRIANVEACLYLMDEVG